MRYQLEERTEILSRTREENSTELQLVQETHRKDLEALVNENESRMRSTDAQLKSLIATTRVVVPAFRQLKADYANVRKLVHRQPEMLQDIVSTHFSQVSFSDYIEIQVCFPTVHYRMN